MRRVVYSLWFLAFGLFLTFFSSSILPNQQSYNLLSKQDIGPDIPSIASLSDDPDMPELMNGSGASFTKGDMDFIRYTVDNHHIAKDCSHNRMIPLFPHPPVVQSQDPSPLPLPQPITNYHLPQTPQQKYQWQPPVDPSTSYARPPRLDAPLRGFRSSILVQPMAFSPIDNSPEYYKGYPISFTLKDRLGYSQFTKNDFAALTLKKYGIINKQVIRELVHDFALFQFPEYCAFINSLHSTDVEDVVIDLYHEIQNDPELAERLDWVRGILFKRMIREFYEATIYKRTGKLTQTRLINIPIEQFDEEAFEPIEETTETVTVDSKEYSEYIRTEREIITQKEPEEPAGNWLQRAGRWCTKVFDKGKKILGKIPGIRSLVGSQEVVTVRTTVNKERHLIPPTPKASSADNNSAVRNNNPAPQSPSPAANNTPVDDQNIALEQPASSSSVILSPVAPEATPAISSESPNSSSQGENSCFYDATRAYLAGLPLGPIINQQAAVERLQALDTEYRTLVVCSKKIERAPPMTSSERLQLERTHLTFDDTYQEIIVDETSSWGTALLRRRDSLNQTLAGEEYSDTTYHVASELEYLFDGADLERLKSRTGNQLATEIHEELLLACNRLCALDPEQIYQPFSLSRAVLASVHYGLETLDKGNLVTSSAFADVCWALQDDMLLDLTLTNAYDDLMIKAHNQVEHILNTLESIAAIPEGLGKRIWNVGEWALRQPGLICENPKQYSIDKAKKAWQITQSLGILSNTNYEPLCDEYDFSWTGSDIQDRLALNDASNEAWAAAWTAVGKQINKDYNESTPRSRGNALGAYIVDCLIMHSLKPHPLGQAFRVTLEEAAVKGELSTLSLKKFDLMRQFFRKSIKETVIESAKISYTKEAFAEFLQEMVHKNPAWFEVPIAEEALCDLFTNLVNELKIVPYTAQELAQMQLYECAMAAASTQAERTACGALLEGIAALPIASEIGSVLAGPVMTIDGQLFVPPLSPIIIPVAPIIALTTPMIIPATPIVPASSVVPPTSGIVPPTGVPSIIVPASVTPPGSILMANVQVYTPAAASVSPVITSPAIQPVAPQAPLLLPFDASCPPREPWQPADVLAPGFIPPMSLHGLEYHTQVYLKYHIMQLPPVADPTCKLFKSPTMDIWRDPFWKEAHKINTAFDQKKYCIKGIPALANKPLTLDAFHLIYPQIIFKNPLKATGLSGFHYDYNFNLHKQGVYEIHSVKEVQGGFFQGSVYMFGAYLGKKAFFPPFWDEKTLANKVIEVLENMTEAPVYSVYDDSYAFYGETSEKVACRVIVTGQGNIKSFYPEKVPEV